MILLHSSNCAFCGASMKFNSINIIDMFCNQSVVVLSLYHDSPFNPPLTTTNINKLTNSYIIIIWNPIEFTASNLLFLFYFLYSFSNIKLFLKKFYLSIYRKSMMIHGTLLSLFAAASCVLPIKTLFL